MPISYRDFDLLIERSGQKYVATVLNSDAGQASHEFRLPFNEEDLAVSLSTIGAVQPR